MFLPLGRYSCSADPTRSGVIAAFKEGKVSKTDAVTAVLNLAQSIEKTMDGTSGALVRSSFFFLAAIANANSSSPIVLVRLE